MNMAQSLQVKIATSQYSVNYNSWPIDWLANYVEKKQRKVITEDSIFIRQNIRLISTAHRNIAFKRLDELFTGLVDRMRAHMKKEEENLFPIIREMVHAKEMDLRISRVTRDKIEWIMELLDAEHNIESRRLKLS